MSAQINIDGNLVRDPEIKDVNGSKVCSFTIACSTRMKKEDGTYDTNFFDCSLWGKPGEYIASRAKKGMRVKTYGHFHQDEYTNKDQEKRYRLRVDSFGADILQKLEPASGAAAPVAKAAPAPAAKDDDDLPF